MIICLMAFIKKIFLVFTMTLQNVDIYMHIHCVTERTVNNIVKIYVIN